MWSQPRSFIIPPPDATQKQKQKKNIPTNLCRNAGVRRDVLFRVILWTISMNQKTMMIAGVVVLGAALIFGAKAYLAYLTPSLEDAKKQVVAELPPPMKDSDIQALVAKVSTHIEVKQGEIPTVATVQDAEVLRAQNPGFYKDASTGDKLLIWSDKAVLYSPTKDILLAVLPMSLPPKTAEDASASGAATSTAELTEEKATIEVRNGSGTVGMGKAMSGKIVAAGLKVSATKDAKDKSGYAKTVIIQVKSDAQFPKQLQILKEVTGADVVELPVAEGSAQSIKVDFLVIVGADFNP